MRVAGVAVAGAAKTVDTVRTSRRYELRPEEKMVVGKIQFDAMM